MLAVRPMREIIAYGEEDLVDLTFEVVEYSKHRTGLSRIEYDVWAKGLYKGKTVGFGLLLSATKKLFQPLKIGVGINSLGEESDNFLKALAELYGETIPEQSKMKKYVPADFFILSNVEDKKECFDNMKVNVKMFFGNTDENDHYCECFLNVDLPSKTVTFCEKDEEYRENIIRCFAL